MLAEGRLTGDMSMLDEKSYRALQPMKLAHQMFRLFAPGWLSRCDILGVIDIAPGSSHTR
ncbi:hypothetical protein [Nocardia heshunensis]